MNIRTAFADLALAARLNRSAQGGEHDHAC
jgi:hypothetical protein